jgi:nitrogen fixation/metabolism regulation signal transduction histidine kinase
MSESRSREEARVRLLSGKMAELGHRLGDTLAQWIAHNERLAKSSNGQVVGTLQAAMSRTVFAVLLALLFASVLGYFTFRQIVHPLRGLQMSVRTIAGGRLHERRAVH